jgi:hypothetical protein
LILHGLGKSKGLLGVTFRTRCVSGDTVLTTKDREGYRGNRQALSLAWRFRYRYRLGRGMGL